MGGGKGGDYPTYTPPPQTDNSAMMQQMLQQQADMNQQMMDNFMKMMNESTTPVTAPTIEPTPPPAKENEDLAFAQPIEEIKKETEQKQSETGTPVSSKPLLDEEAPITTMLRSLLTTEDETESALGI